MPISIATERIVHHHQDSVRKKADYVLYWMNASRRTTSNYTLDAALACAKRLDKPLIVVEAIRAGYRWASDRFHRFVLDGMHDNRAAFAGSGIGYYAYVEPAPGEGKGLLKALGERACCVFTDHYPAFFLPRAVSAAFSQLNCAAFAIDGNGFYPAQLGRDYPTAAVFRRYLHKRMLECEPFPALHPLGDTQGLSEAELPASVLKTWPEASDALLQYGASLQSIDIDHEVAAAALVGGAVAARAQCDTFVAERLERYPERNHPDDDGASGLSPYLHFGHIGSHDVMRAVMKARNISGFDFRPEHVAKRRGFYGADEDVEGFIDELLTWRELGFVFAHHRPDDYDKYESVPEWARRSLAEHATDPREVVYSCADLDAAETEDDIWNAAQNQLKQTGVMHNYLRMLWGKKVLQWSARPEDAFLYLVDLNNRYALDGRDPNSYTGIAWTFGRHDRAWGPERPIFGKVRYMTSDSTRRKLRLKKYLARYAPPSVGTLL